jgi:hypothetical protein
MSINSNSSNSTDSRPTNLVEFESQEVNHKFGLDKYPDIFTKGLLISLRDLVKSMYAPSYSRHTDIQFMALQYWTEMCIELLDIRIQALYNRIEKCGK